MAEGIAQDPEIALESGGRGVDLFRFDGYVTYTVRRTAGRRSLRFLPPSWRSPFEADGTVALLINDGMHRLYLARMEWVVPQVTYVAAFPRHIRITPFPGGSWEGWIFAGR